MAPDTSEAGNKVPPSGIDRPQQSRSEPQRDDSVPSSSDLNPRTVLQEGSRTEHVDLTQDDEPDNPRKHPHENTPRIEPSNKRVKHFGDNTTMEGTKSTSSTSSDPEIMNLENEIQRLKATEREKEQQLRDRRSQLEQERRTHEQTRNACNTAQANLRDKNQVLAQNERELQVLQDAYRNAKNAHSQVVAIKDRDLNTQAGHLNALLLERDSIERSKAQVEQDLAFMQRACGDTKTKLAAYEVTMANMEQELVGLRRSLDSERSNRKKALVTANDELQEMKQELQEVEDQRKNEEALREAYLTVQEDQATLLVKCEQAKKNAQKQLVLSKKETKAAEKEFCDWRTEHNEEVAKLEEESAKLKEESTKLKEESTKLKAMIKKRNADFVKQSRESNEKCSDLLQQLRDSQGLSQRHNFKFSDDEIKDTWGTLKHKIDQFVNKHTRPVSDPNNKVNQSWIVSLSPFMPKLLATPSACAYAFEACMWEKLRLVVFDARSASWAGRLGQDFDSLSSQVKDLLNGPEDDMTTEYHTWRATSGNMLSRLSERTRNFQNYGPHIDSWVRALQNIIGPSIDAHVASKDISDIIQDARAFEVIRRKLKAQVTICCGDDDLHGKPARYGMPVNEDYMSVCPINIQTTVAHPEPTVQLIVSPALIRSGNSSGIGYDRTTCLIPMVVLASRGPARVRSEDLGRPQPTPEGQQKDGAGGSPYGQTRLPNNKTRQGVQDFFTREQIEPNIKTEPSVQDAQLDARSAVGGRSAASKQSASADMSVSASSRPTREASKVVRKLCAKAQQQDFEESDQD